MNKKQYSSVVVGGGAAGFFAAITCAESSPKRRVLLLEKTQKLLSKVRVSGGGRCNVTHSCFDPSELIKNYPRGSRELLGPFTRFQPRDTVEWFKKRSVKLTTESDGRMFPVTERSQTIIDCFIESAKNVEIQCGQGVARIDRKENGFLIQLKSGKEITAETVMLATGGAAAGHSLAKALGHTIIEPVPSLFTFNIPASPLHHLSGVSLDNVTISLPEFRSKQSGPLMITHWGFSGPSVLKLSAFCARKLHDANYQTFCQVDWSPDFTEEQLRGLISKRKETQPTKFVVGDFLAMLPKQLWKSLVALSGITDEIRWTNLSKTQSEKLIRKIKGDRYQISGQTTNKQEFVTCGGVKLSEVNFRTMESYIVPGLFFGGEILDIDGITGGFNFQAAWTTGWLAGKAMRNACKPNA